MANDITATSTIEIKTDPTRVWDALTNPEIIKEYFFGTRAATDWQVGSPITFTGEYQGKYYKDKGTILAVEPEKLLRYTYWSSMSGKEDVYDNYIHVQYDLKAQHHNTLLTVTNERVDTEEAKQHMEQNWDGVLQNLKTLLEK